MIDIEEFFKDYEPGHDQHEVPELKELPKLEAESE